MLGDIEETAKHLTAANKDDLTKIGLEEKEFLDKAQLILELFCKKGKIHGAERIEDSNGLIFAFPNNENRLDVLSLKDSKLIYTAKDTTFFSNGHKSILQSAGQVVLSTDGRSLIVHRPCAHFCCH
jgi:hypothetical protein